jgi:predicted NUDIX family NTP pyrophosphohydrolase
MFRRRGDAVQVFLVHPGGPFWAKKDKGAWSIPKGEREPDEDPLEAARREFEEETGFIAEGNFRALTPVKVSSRKIVEAWYFEGDVDPEALHSNTFSIEWPPRSGSVRTFPEVDRGDWFGLAEARTKLVKGQLPLIDEFEKRLALTANGEAPSTNKPFEMP